MQKGIYLIKPIYTNGFKYYSKACNSKKGALKYNYAQASEDKNKAFLIFQFHLAPRAKYSDLCKHKYHIL